MLLKSKLLSVLSCAALILPLTIQAAEQEVGIAQIKKASALGASCSGYYDGVFALLHNLKQNDEQEKIESLQTLWPEIGQKLAFRQATSAMVMTDIFISQINQNVTSDQAVSLQTFSEDYVSSRKRTMQWDGKAKDSKRFSDTLTQCEHILQIMQNNKTLSVELINSAVQQRAQALGVDLSVVD